MMDELLEIFQWGVIAATLWSLGFLAKTVRGLAEMVRDNEREKLEEEEKKAAGKAGATWPK